MAGNKVSHPRRPRPRWSQVMMRLLPWMMRVPVSTPRHCHGLSPLRPINSYPTWSLTFHPSWLYWPSLFHPLKLNLGDSWPIIQPEQLYSSTRNSRYPSACSLRISYVSGKVPFMYLVLGEYTEDNHCVSVPMSLYPSGSSTWVDFWSRVDLLQCWHHRDQFT